jgi:hypothetical protein
MVSRVDHQPGIVEAWFLEEGLIHAEAVRATAWHVTRTW